MPKPKEKTYKELLEALRAPIPKEHIKDKQVGGGRTASYINITKCKDLLDERIGPDKWEASVSSMALNETGLVLIVRITFHAVDGAYSTEGTGYTPIVYDKRNVATVPGGRGDLPSNSYAQAFRRALEGIGFAREIWRDGLSEEQMDIAEAQHQKAEAKAKDKANEPATKAQIDTLHTLLTEFNEANPDEQRAEADVAQFYSAGNTDLFGELTNEQAGNGIMGLPKATAAAKKKASGASEGKKGGKNK